MHAPGKTLSGAVLWRRGACVSSLLRHRRRGEAAAAEEPLSWGEKQPEVPRTFRRWHPRRRRVNYGILARRWETRLEDLHVLRGEAATAPCPRATFPADAETFVYREKLAQLRLHFCTRSLLGPCPPGKRREARLSHSSPFPSPHHPERSGKGLGLCGRGASQAKGISSVGPHADMGILSLHPAPASSAPAL